MAEKRAGADAVIAVVVAVIVHVLVVAALAVANEGRPDLGNPSQVTFLAFVFAQAGLVSVVAGVGNLPSFVRLPGWLVLVTGVGVLCGYGVDQSSRPEQYAIWAVLLLVIGGAQLAAMSVLRARGVRLERVGARRRNRGRLQFSLGHLLGWTAALAALAAIFRWTGFEVRWLSDLLVGEVHVAVIVLSVPAVCAGASGAWAALGNEYMGLRLGVMFVVVPIVAGLPGATLRIPPDDDGGLLLAYVLSSWIVAATLWIVRLSGYRLTWSGPAIEPGSAGPARVENRSTA